MPPPYGGGGIIKATDMVQQLSYLADMWIPASATHPAALICVLLFTVTSSFHGLAWPAMGLVVLPSPVQ